MINNLASMNETEQLHIRRLICWLLGLLSVFVAVLIVFYAISSWKTWRQYDPISGPRQINVTGEGKAAFKPDVAVFSVGVVTEHRLIKDAQGANTQRSNAIQEFLKKNGIEEKDLKTVEYSVFPQYQYYDIAPCTSNVVPCSPRRPPEIVSYQVRQTIEVKVRDLDKTDDLLEGVVTAGANEVGSVTFRLDDENKAQAEARKKAIDDARQKAEVLSRDLGVRLGKIIAFSEGGTAVPIYERAFDQYGKGGGGLGSAAPLPQVQPGQQEVVSTVSIVYEFR